MQTLTLHEKVGDDGILRLQMPFEPRGADVEVVVVIQTEIQTEPKNGNGAKRASIMDFAGIITDETLVAPDELSWDEERFSLE